jgi:hypothetical protein
MNRLLFSFVLCVVPSLMLSQIVPAQVTPLTTVNTQRDEYSPFWHPVMQCVVVVRSQGDHTQFVSVETGDTLGGSFCAKNSCHAYMSSRSAEESIGTVFFPHSIQSWPGLAFVRATETGIELVRPIDELNGPFFVSQPALSPDGSRLVIVTNREGGMGKLDLWLCTRSVDNTWQAPVLLSTAVNSPEDEITPFFLSNDSLAYSSNGYGGKGGFDVFVTVYRGGQWLEPEPLDILNSEFDDSDAVRTPLGVWYVCSNRAGGKGGLDVYRVGETLAP